MSVPQQTLLDYLAGPALNELMMTMDVRRGLPGVLPDDFFKPSAVKPFTDKVIFDHRTGQRKPATIISPASPTPQFQAPAQQRKEAVCVHAGENMAFDAETIHYLKANVPMVRDRIERKINEDIKDWKIRFENLRNALVQNAIFTGQISYLPTLAGTPAAAQIGVDGGIPTPLGQIVASGTSNSEQITYGLNYAGSNALAKTNAIPNTVDSATVLDWSQSTTNIPANFRSMEEGFEKTSNYKVARVLYGKSIPDYFAANTLMQTFMSRQPQLNKEFEATNELPKGLLGVDWYPAWRCYYVDYTGAIKSLCAANQIVLLPEINEDWYEFVEGGWLLPTGVVAPGSTFEQAVTQTQIQNGQGSYMSWTLDPYSIRIVSRDCVLPVLKNPNVPWSITVS